MVTINIAKDFSDSLGPRQIDDGPHSGQEFRQEFLETHFENPNDDYPITIILDGLEGSPSSFLEEAFGGLARVFSKQRCKKRLRFVCREDPILLEEIMGYIENATPERRR